MTNYLIVHNFSQTEFGAVLLNLESGEIKSSFHEYVRPTHRPVLSEYCINLTGITQALVDTQSEFNVVYQKFVTWLEEIRVLYQLKFATPNMRNIQSGINAAVCTWTLWDLRNYLPTSCKRYGITPAPHLRACVDVRYIFEVSFTDFCLNLFSYNKKTFNFYRRKYIQCDDHFKKHWIL